MKEVSLQDFNQFLCREIRKVHAVACEDFVIDPTVKGWENTTTKRNTTTTAKLIGRVELACHIAKIPLEMFAPSTKPFSYQLIGMQYQKGKKGMHRFDAWAHARNYYRKVYSV